MSCAAPSQQYCTFSSVLSLSSTNTKPAASGCFAANAVSTSLYVIKRTLMGDGAWRSINQQVL